jgi:hypothetical protein
MPYIDSCFIIPPFPGWGGGYTVLPLSVLPSVQDIFHRIFLSNYQWQKSDIWSQASYRYAILWVAFLDPSDSYFLFADVVGFYTHWPFPALQQTGSRNLTGQKTLPTIWHTYMKLVTKYQISAINSCREKCDEKYLGWTDRGKTVYPPPPSGSGGITIFWS